MRLHSIGIGSLFVGAALVAGCGGPVDVQGTIVRNGKPVTGAQVAFIPVKGGQEAGDLTDEEGNFRLKNPKKFGIVPGEYLVTVSKLDFPPGMPRPSAHELNMALTAKMKETMPVHYTLQDKTPLRVTVPRGGIKDVVLDIK